jgi:hypothetical protein
MGIPRRITKYQNLWPFPPNFNIANLPTIADAIQLSYRVKNLGHIPGRGVPIFWLSCLEHHAIRLPKWKFVVERFHQAADSDDDAAAFDAVHMQHSFPNK